MEDGELIARLGLGPAHVDAIAAEEFDELRRRVQRYRQGRARAPLRDRTVVLIDDGLATGTTAKAAIKVLRRQEPAAVVLAVPVMPAVALPDMRALADDVVAVATPRWLGSIGEFYADFRQTTDDEVARLLGEHGDAGQRSTSRDVVIPAGHVRLRGTLTVPPDARGAVVFAHGRGKSRRSRRNRVVARMLEEGGFATLLFDLLTEGRPSPGSTAAPWSCSRGA